MAIKRVSIHSLAIPLTVPYTIAYVTVHETVNHFIVLEDHNGVRGIGCAAPAPDVTGETPEMSLAALHRIPHLLAEHGLMQGETVDSGLQPHSNGPSGAYSLTESTPYDEVVAALRGTPSAMTALDMALADLSASATNCSLHDWLGGSPMAGAAFQPVLTSVTIGISSTEETLERAELLIGQGIRFLKIKGGHQVQQDIERLKALRDTWGPDLRLALDANQGYSIRDVEALQSHASVLNLRYLEQPTPKTDFPTLGLAARCTSIAVMADEAIQTADDARRIADLGSVGLINIKLQKMGGLKASSVIDGIAREAGMQTMLGCMDESALSIAAALYFGSAHPNVVLYDLDGHMDLSSDPFEKMVSLRDGMLSALITPGLSQNWAPASGLV